MSFKLSERFLQPKNNGWGGRRIGAGRPKGSKSANPRPKKEKEYFDLSLLNPIQRKVLIEIGNGDVSKGIQKVLSEHL